MPGDSNLCDALREWKMVLKEHQIFIDTEKLKKYIGTTGIDCTYPEAVLLPISTEEVSAVARIASKYQVPLYPISCGKNWGYGDACPPTNGQVIVDLGQMNRIIEVNSKLAYAVIEPGVTQGQLFKYLAENKTPLWMDATGAGPDTSLVGNTVDRGFGHTRYGDHFHNTCGMEVVLADGRILQTGFGHYHEARGKYVYRYGIGPVLDGIFSQSNFGIVTRIGIWLMPKPEDFCAFFFSCPNETDLADVIDILAPLKLQGVLQSAIHIANDLRTISGRVGYPWHLTNGITPLSDALRVELRNRFGFGAWNGCGSISGPKKVVSAIRKDLKKTLKSYRPIFLNDRNLDAAERWARILGKLGVAKKLSERLAVVRPTYEMLKGVPVTEHLKGACWRVRDRNGKNLLNPLEAGAGLIWISPILPLEGAQAQELVNLLSTTYQKHGFETLVTFTLLTERALCCVSNISFDRNNKDELEKARDCYEDMTTQMMNRGLFPYRVGPLGFEKLNLKSTVFWDVVKDIKTALDPHGIMSPGRYEPPSLADLSVTPIPRAKNRLA